MKNIDAISIIRDHLANAAHLTGDPTEPRTNGLRTLLTHAHKYLYRVLVRERRPPLFPSVLCFHRSNWIGKSLRRAGRGAIFEQSRSARATRTFFPNVVSTKQRGA